MTPTVLEQRAYRGPHLPERRRAKRGQGVAEFSLCAPIAVMMLLGIVEGGFLMFGVGTAAYATGRDRGWPEGQPGTPGPGLI
jgi:hypothetical protein